MGGSSRAIVCWREGAGSPGVTLPPLNASCTPPSLQRLSLPPPPPPPPPPAEPYQRLQLRALMALQALASADVALCMPERDPARLVRCLAPYLKVRGGALDMSA